MEAVMMSDYKELWIDEYNTMIEKLMDEQDMSEVEAERHMRTLDGDPVGDALMDKLTYTADTVRSNG
tara:strand:+ start:1586 stop:1786 length:201 start_codon:yes stop_codon:yes gene_type:complete